MTLQSPFADAAPPEFLQLAGHPLRWRLLGELARSDRMVHELTGLVGEAQNLVSYHLGKLRDGRLVSARRSSADRPGHLLRPGPGAGRRPAVGGRRRAAPGPSPRAARSRDTPPIAPVQGAVPLHRQQRALADGRGAGPRTLRRRRRGV